METPEIIQKLKKYHFDKIIPLFFILFIFMVLELISTFLYAPANELDRILRVLRQDSLLFWELKPNLSTNFQGVAVDTDSRGLRIPDRYPLKDFKQHFTVACLGGSPTFGWGIDYEHTYPSLLEDMLNKNLSAKKYRVINAGIIGYSSYQGKLFLEHRILGGTLPYIITVSYLVNDIDKHRFYRNNGKPDKDLGIKNHFLVSLENFLEGSKLFLFLRQKILKLKGLDRRFYSQVSKFYPENRRVSLGDYKENLRYIVDLARKRHIGVVFIKMMVRFPFEPEPISKDILISSNEILGEAVKLVKSGKCSQAVLKLKEVIEKNPYSAKAYYYLGFCSTMNSDNKAAQAYFDKAKKMELLECAMISQDYNQTMEEVALEKNVVLVDIKDEFLSSGDLKELFVDSDYDLVHPNEKGHRIIADRVYYALDREKLMGR